MVISDHFMEYLLKDGNFKFCEGLKLSAQKDLLKDSLACHAAMNEFCDRVEKGEVHSRKTYAKFCKILGRKNYHPGD